MPFMVTKVKQRLRATCKSALCPRSLWLTCGWRRTDKEFQLKADVPGLQKEDIKVLSRTNAWETLPSLCRLAISGGCNPTGSPADPCLCLL